MVAILDGCSGQVLKAQNAILVRVEQREAGLAGLKRLIPRNATIEVRVRAHHGLGFR
ncbi:hypothetical protein [Caulobacter sp.]|uniref:hypothetical protein n=1 Tax=Caulobacter sp. TaxID=78 RepID=UPI003BA99E7A